MAFMTFPAKQDTGILYRMRLRRVGVTWRTTLGKALPIGPQDAARCSHLVDLCPPLLDRYSCFENTRHIVIQDSTTMCLRLDKCDGREVELTSPRPRQIRQPRQL